MARNERTGTGRRFLLAAGSASAAATLAGCTADTRDTDGPPQPDEDKLEQGGWTERSTSSDRMLDREFLGGKISITADAETTQYEDSELRQTLKERTLGGLDTSLALFSVTRIVLDPNPASLPMGLGVDRVLSEIRGRARSQFETLLADSGLSNVRQQEDRELTLATGETTTLTQYAAEYRYDGMDVPLPGATETTTIEGGAIDVAGMFAVWQDGRHIVVAGGAHPASNVTTSVSEELSEAITVDVDVDLGLTPKQYGTELRTLIASIQ